MENWERLIPKDIQNTYEFFNFNHAAEILSQAYMQELEDLFSALRQFRITSQDIQSPGGSESAIPKKISEVLRPLQWEEIKITGNLEITLHTRNSTEKAYHIENYIDGHNIDYVKNKVAIDLEWNSKDQTFDRDLYAFRTFYECGVISCGVLITRSEQLNTVFSALDVKQKYGASTTWMGKLLPRIQARRHGGCPLLIVGILPEAIVDWEASE